MNEFRFLVMCLLPHRENSKITLEDVVNTIYVPTTEFPCVVKMFAVVGAIIRKEMWGKHLDLMAWRASSKLEREKLGGYVGTPLIIPQERGPICVPYEISVPADSPGVFGFDLFDREGAFGSPEGLLATYLYGIDVKQPPHHGPGQNGDVKK